MTAPAVGYTETRPLRPNLSVLIIGDSGAGKTPLFDAILEPITLLQREIEEKQTRLNAQYAEELENQNAAKLEKKKLESKRKRIKDDAQLVEIDEELDALDDAIFKPLKEPRHNKNYIRIPKRPKEYSRRLKSIYYRIHKRANSSDGRRNKLLVQRITRAGR